MFQLRAGRARAGEEHRLVVAADDDDRLAVRARFVASAPPPAESLAAPTATTAAATTSAETATPGSVTPAPRLNFFDGSAVRIANTLPLSATNIVLPSALYATLVSRPLPS